MTAMTRRIARHGLVLCRRRAAGAVRGVSVLLDADHHLQAGRRPLQPPVHPVLVQRTADAGASRLSVHRHAVPALARQHGVDRRVRRRHHARGGAAGRLQPRPHAGPQRREPRHRHLPHLSGAADAAVPAAVARDLAARAAGLAVVAGRSSIRPSPSRSAPGC